MKLSDTESIVITGNLKGLQAVNFTWTNNLGEINMTMEYAAFVDLLTQRDMHHNIKCEELTEDED